MKLSDMPTNSIRARNAKANRPIFGGSRATGPKPIKCLVTFYCHRSYSGPSSEFGLDMPATTYKVFSWGSPIGIGATGSCHVAVAGIAKKATDRDPYIVANEVVC